MKLSIVLAWASVVRASAGGPFDWNSITPTRQLQYTPCYDGFECARLQMPLDWLDGSNDETVAIAMVKLPAKVQTNHEDYGGTVILNPGGPGDSGVIHALRNARYMQKLMDGRKHYEILSFDPRGMFHSTPVADCNLTSEARAAAGWQSKGLGGANIDSSPNQLRHLKALMTATGMQCSQQGQNGYVIQEFMSTASVARDMLRMVDEIDRLEAGAVPAGSSQQPLSSRRGDPRLQYYGTSYGTILGNYFVSMFPGRVRRMILDGVVIADDWVKADWVSDFYDTAEAIHYFYRTCFEANCALRKSTDTSWRDLQDRVGSLVERLNTNPAAVVPPDGGPASFITGYEVQDEFFARLYSPLDHFENLSNLLAEAIRGNYTLMLAGLYTGPDGPEELSKYPWQGEASRAVSCGDAEDVRERDMDFWMDYIRRTHEACPEMSVGAGLAFSCSGWQARPKYRFEGPFKSPEADSRGINGHPSAPLLFLSSLHDPITPLRSAKIVSKQHPGSRVLVQNGVGHCTLLSGPSACTKRAIEAYMENGTMPEVAECDQDCVPFKECPYDRGRFPR